MIDIISPAIFTYLFIGSYKQDVENAKKELTSREATCKMITENKPKEEYEKCLKKLSKIN